MWYYDSQIIKTPKTITIDSLRYGKRVFLDSSKLKELGIKPYREITPDNRYFNNGAYTVDTSGDEVVGTYAQIGKDTDSLTKNMLNTIKSQLTSKLKATDWYYLRKLRTGTDVPSDIQDYSDALYSEYDTKKSEIAAMSKISQIQEYQNRSFTETRKIATYNEDGSFKEYDGTTTNTREINMCMHWVASPNDKVDPAFVSLTAD